MKKIYVAVSIEEDNKYYAFIDTIQTGVNLKPFLERYTANIVRLCETKKQAEEIVAHWNACYKVNNQYLFN